MIFEHIRERVTCTRREVGDDSAQIQQYPPKVEEFIERLVVPNHWGASKEIPASQSTAYLCLALRLNGAQTSTAERHEDTRGAASIHLSEPTSSAAQRQDRKADGNKNPKSFLCMRKRIANFKQGKDELER